MRNLLSLVVVFAHISLLSAQNQTADTASYPYWIEMMQDEKANFFETQDAFETYWQNRDREKGDGWKIFKRWEYFTELRVDEKGNKVKPGHNLSEYQKYFGSGDKSSNPVSEDHWQELGPVTMPANGTGQPNGLGRINCMAFHPSNGNLFYAGAPAGGLWKTSDGGITWENLTDTLPTLGVSSMVIDHVNSSVLYLGTGDRDGSDAPGLGVWKSTDGGDTWNVSNSGMGNRVVGKMIMNPLDRTVLIAATSSGIYKTSNSGQSWVRKSSNTIHYKDLVYKPGDTSIVYATASGNFFRSSDGGETWSNITSGLPSSNRMVIGVSPANANYVYLVLTNSRTFKGLYRSTNSGLNFSVRSTTPNIMDYRSDGSGTSGQAWYDLCIAVDPTNANVLYVGGVNIWQSSNGGSYWTIKAHWTFGASVPGVHADHHELIFSPANGRLYNGNDGGVYYTSNSGNTWTEISSGLSVAQIYKIGQSAQSDALTINGYQDNGTAIYDGSWRTEIGGDGMECIIDPSDSNFMYGALYYGAIRRSTNYGVNFSNIASSISESGNWVTPYILKEGSPDVMIAGFKNIWISTNVKTSPTSAISFTQVSNNLGGLNTAGIRVLESSPANTDMLYFARDDNKLFRTENISSATPTYTNLGGNLPTNNWPRDIEAHPTDVNKVYIVQSNSVYESNNKGASWTDISGSLPNVSVNCIVFDSSSSGDLYVGTDLGVFFKGSWMSDWIPFNGGMPMAPEVTELEIYYDNDNSKSRIKAATYGRGLWSSPLYVQLSPDFEANENQLCAGQTVTYTNLSEGFYTDLLWDFPGGSPSSSIQLSPTVTYNNTGVYSASLKIWNQYEGDSITYNAYITVDSIPVITVSPSFDTIVYGDTAVLKASGATTYTWSPISGLNVFKGSIVKASPSISTNYTVTGVNPNCTTGSGSANSYIHVLGVGIDDASFAGGVARVFPNPTNSEFNIEFNDIQGTDLRIEMFDISGKMVYQSIKNNTSPNSLLVVPTSSLENGMYLMKLNSAQTAQQVIFKIIVDHSF